MDVHDLLGPLDEVRDLKAEGKLPILFLDEFDANDRNYPLLLPLLWDGELSVGGRTLKLGKIVVILAGSSASLGDAINDAKNVQLENDDIKNKKDANDKDVYPPKMIDLVSRINGGEISIPTLENNGTGNNDGRVNKICLTISLLRARFGSDLERVPWGLLKFISGTKFRHGARSVANFVDSIARIELTEGALNLAQLNLPLADKEQFEQTNLRMHIIEKGGPDVVVERWRDCQVGHMVRIANPFTEAFLRVIEAIPRP